MPEPAAAPSLPDPIRRGPDPALGPPPPVGQLQPFLPMPTRLFGSSTRTQRRRRPHASTLPPPKTIPPTTTPPDTAATTAEPAPHRTRGSPRASTSDKVSPGSHSTTSETCAQPVRTRHHPTPGDFGTAVYCPVSVSFLRPFVRFSKTVRPDTTSAVPAHRPVALQDTLRRRHTRWEAPGTIGPTDPTVCPGPGHEPGGM
jgi:hypothetical protein